ncbi:YbaB/EbfC family nucleoid-associated protein [Thermomonospora umbrina]|uniref:YbaB/EbfC DNA-binding family protein n=1 Tax=Thermomonospora umbrina TaxID=111806 RepID=A0A3D9SY81_9ACTN|nr:YbaB/EbfC family nucleoid-associated protein [Thermomonospora umbrina]REE96571.1 YbaB/EbfC DNA-binding family protein [Thermomonospora umbrina]
MTAGFGDFGNIDVDGFLGDAKQRFARVQEMQERLQELVGRAEGAEGRVRAEVSYGTGLSELVIDPRAMRISSGELAETIKAVIAAASADLQRQQNELMGELYGAELQQMTDPETAMAKAEQAKASYDKTMADVMGQLERMQRRMGL